MPRLLCVLSIVLLVAACAPAPTATPLPAALPTPAATATPTPSPTSTPPPPSQTPTPTTPPPPTVAPSPTREPTTAPTLTAEQQRDQIIETYAPKIQMGSPEKNAIVLADLKYLAPYIEKYVRMFAASDRPDPRINGYLDQIYAKHPDATPLSSIFKDYADDPLRIFRPGTTKISPTGPSGNFAKTASILNSIYLDSTCLTIITIFAVFRSCGKAHLQLDRGATALEFAV